MIDVPRMIYMGMSMLHYTEREVLFMTPRKFDLMMDAYRKCNGIKDRSMDNIKDLI